MGFQVTIKEDLMHEDSTADQESLKMEVVQKIPPYDNQLHRRFTTWLDQSGKSLKAVAPMLARSAALISQYINIKYTGNIAELEEDIRNLLRREEELDYVERADVFCGTGPATLMWEVLQFCDKRCTMGIVTAPSGTGKSETCKEFKRRNRLSIYIPVKLTMRTIGSMLRKIAMRTGGIPRKQSLNDLLETIIDRIKGSHRLLMLDDSHYLSWEQIEVIKSLHDCAQIGIVLLGQERLYDQMRGATDKAYLFDQTYSRIAIKRRQFKIEKKDARMIAETIVPNLDKQCVDYLHKKAAGQGRFRVMRLLLDLALERSVNFGKPIDLDLLKEVDGFLMQ